MTPSPAFLTGDTAFGALAILDYLQDLITVSPLEQFPKADLLILLNDTRTHPQIFDAETVLMYDQITTTED